MAGSPIRHENAVQGSAVEVQTYQPPWKALSEFALQSDLDQPAFQQLVRPLPGPARPQGSGWDKRFRQDAGGRGEGGFPRDRRLGQPQAIGGGGGGLQAHPSPQFTLSQVSQD